MIFFIAIVVMALFLCALLPDNNPSGAIMRILIFLAVPSPAKSSGYSSF